MIREAVKDDIPRIIDMGRELANQSYAGLFEYDTESMSLTVSELIESDSGVVLVFEHKNRVVGVVAALVFPMYLNRVHITAQELWIWVDPLYRGQAGRELMKGLETAVREKGARSLSMTAQHSIRPEATGKLYCRAGFYPTDHTYMKGL